MKTHYKLAFINNLISPIDNELKSTVTSIQQCDDAYTFGLYDQYEQILGIGFTICQTFLTSVHKGDDKDTVFSLGPYHSNGISYAQITNSCANYWKHNEEWKKDSIKWQAKNIIKIFETFNADVWSEFPLSEVFHLLFDNRIQGSFKELLSFLNQWSNEV